MKIEGAQNNRLTHLQLVQFSLKTVISLLGPSDIITLITFDTKAQVDISNINLTVEGKKRVESIIDLYNDDKQHGIIARSYRKNKFNKKGKNILYSLLRFHMLEQCGNFRDMSIQLYGNEYFRIFRKIPKSQNSHHYSRISNPKRMSHKRAMSSDSDSDDDLDMEYGNDYDDEDDDGKPTMKVYHSKRKLYVSSDSQSESDPGNFFDDDIDITDSDSDSD